MAGIPVGSARRVRALAAVASGVLVVAAGIAMAPPAAAATGVGTPTFTAPSTVTRGAAAQLFTVSVPTTEGATFNLAASGADLTFTLPGSCSTDVGGVSCTITADAVTIGDDGDASAEELVTATFNVGVSAASSVALSSTEGTVAMEKDSGITVTATATGSTGGGTQTSTEGDIDIIANPSTDAVIELETTTNPVQPSPFVTRGASSTITYTATLTRSGNVSQVTVVSVAVAAIAANGTTLATSSPQTVTFLANETTKAQDFVVNVPATATAGQAATYQFTATYDPSGTDGSPIDTETGNATSFNIVAGNPTVSLSLSGSPTDGSTLARGDAATYTLIATNTGAAGSVDATNVDVTVPLPSSSQLTIGTPTASTGTPSVNSGDGTSPQTVTVTFPTIAQGSSATLTIPVAVTPGAVKTGGSGFNDLVAGPATATFSPPVSTSATASGTVKYEIRADADLSVSLTPATQTVGAGGSGELTATVNNAGPDPASSIDVTLTVSETAGSGSPTFVAPFAPGCVADPTPTTMHCTASALAAGSSSLNFGFYVSQSGTGTATVQASVSSAEADPGGNTDTADIVFDATASLSLSTDSIAFGSQGVGTGSSLRTVTVTSDGTAPTDITAITRTGANPGDFVVASQNCTGDPLLPGQTCTIQLRFRPTAAGARSATLNIVSDAADSPDTVALAGTGTARANLRVSIGANPNPVRQGGQLTYKVVVANNGPSPAKQVRMTLTLPSGTQFQSLTKPAEWSCSAPARGTTGTLVCQRARLASGASNTLSIVVKVVAAKGSTISATAAVSSPTFDPVAADNRATVTTSVSA